MTVIQVDFTPDAKPQSVITEQDALESAYVSLVMHKEWLIDQFSESPKNRAGIIEDIGQVYAALDMAIECIFFMAFGNSE